MDQALNERWNNACRPFDGVTLDFEESLNEAMGEQLVPWLIEELDRRIVLATTLLINEDWHIHDGFILESAEITKDRLLVELRSQPEKWFRVINYQVYWGIYDASYRYYLRFGHDEDEPIINRDVTGSEQIVWELADAVYSEFGVIGKVESAKGFFDRLYGG